MALDEAGMHRAGLAFLYRIVPVLVATVLYGIYVAILSVATRGLWHRGLRNPYNALILGVLYLVFCLSSALWALEVAQLIGLVDLLLSPGTLTTDALFNRFYDLIARETRVTGILFQSQMVAGDILVIWRASAIWHDQRIVVLLPLFWWTLMIGNMLAHASRCQSGVSTTNYSKLCKVTDVAAPVLSITTNISVMILVLWKGWQLREALTNEYQRRRENKIFTLFVLMVESGTLYAIMLWPFYLGLYGNYTIWNYAVGGAVCSNKLTPLSDIPDVSSGQQAWFVQDHVVRNGTSHQKLLLDPASFIVIIFVGTNDVGVNSFVTNDQGTNVSLPNVADCQLDTLRQLHALGARQFIVNSLVPLQLTRLYSDSSDPTIYYPSPPHNGTVWHRTIFNLVHSLNRILRDGVRTLDTEWGGGGSVQWFDTYGFFEEMYNHPARYFNGSVPANVTGQCHQCPDPDDWRQCGIGDCTPDERDSYMWWDELHPSEQTGRNLAAEMHRKIEGKSKY
ncbi:hypothetical protein BD311DRAFT_808567 [Dichomitus squalens]|uniref:Uncharacterized protein n=1 Tax=Dichomitus squalens TaxID=114155 RepID=A0A4Q9MFT1_9APHY|nr:hypothetical protein BD311DRAFT_808567 [Dichomitus squalens]